MVYVVAPLGVSCINYRVLYFTVKYWFTYTKYPNTKNWTESSAKRIGWFKPFLRSPFWPSCGLGWGWGGFRGLAGGALPWDFGMWPVF